ncbi:MAG: cytochrome c biogenesis CcdA family protein [Deltaproteobacteria bacterium]|jgi:cytochrome c biogenesis protein CcdA|nr:cytochrome c biogenesis CcdA family protein [Deltaproteobacteria bacterium]
MDSFLELWRLAFLPGLLSFLSPCAVPMAPAYMAVMTLNDGEASFRRRSLARTAAFALGTCLPFFLFGLVLTANTFAEPLGFAAFGLLAVIAGLKRLIRPPQSCPAGPLRPGRSGKPGLIASFGLGLIGSFGWTACTGPLVAAILGLAAGRGGLSGAFWLILVYCLGLMGPFFLFTLGGSGLERKLAGWREGGLCSPGWGEPSWPGWAAGLSGMEFE